MKIRMAQPYDYQTIYHVVKEAFSTAEHSDGTEQVLVEQLRQSDAFIPELSLIAEIGQKIVGHIMFTKASVGTEAVLALAPLSVLPQYQCQGIGSALVKEGHKIARDLGYEYSVVLGSEKYYPRFGYSPAKEYQISPPFEVPDINYMALQLCEDAKAISGTVCYAREFGLSE